MMQSSQGKLVLKDFNIEDEAGGIGKAIVKQFPVVVINSTIEIRLYWAGKGTTGVPVRGVYGPLISAISLNPGRFNTFPSLILFYSASIMAFTKTSKVRSKRVSCIM